MQTSLKIKDNKKDKTSDKNNPTRTHVYFQFNIKYAFGKYYNSDQSYNQFQLGVNR